MASSSTVDAVSMSDNYSASEPGALWPDVHVEWRYATHCDGLCRLEWHGAHEIERGATSRDRDNELTAQSIYVTARRGSI